MSDPTKPWFHRERKDLAQALQSQVALMELSPLESKRRTNLLYDLELYLGRKMTSLYEVSGGDYERLWNPEELVFNVCYSIANTIRNRICSFRARAQWLPNGGDYKARRAARDRTAMSDAWAIEQQYQEEASLMLRDLLIGDGGVLKLYKEATDGGDKPNAVCVGRFPSWEFLYDEAESIYRKPECAYHVTYVPIELAEGRYGIARANLASAVVSSPPGMVYVSNRNLVRVVEGWARNGVHATVVGNDVVGDVEDWKHDGFPLVQRTFDEGHVGIWGNGCIAPIRSIQLELNEMQTTLRECHRNSAYKIISVQQNEDVGKVANNAYVQVLPYLNTPPQVQVPPPIHPEVYQYVELLKRQAYETIGVSQMLAGGQPMQHLDSRPAIREASEVQTDRLANLSQLWESTRTEAAVWWDRFSCDLARSGVEMKWRGLHRGAFKELVFGDLENKWEIRPFPSSVFGQSVSGRLDRAVDLIKGGFMSKEDAMKALDLPDISPIVDNLLAESYAQEWLVDGILEDGIYRQPDPYLDPMKLDAYARNRYFLAISDGSNYPKGNVSKLRRLIDANGARVKAQVAQQTPPATPQGPALQGASPEMLAMAGANGAPVM